MMEMWSVELDSGIIPHTPNYNVLDEHVDPITVSVTLAFIAYLLSSIYHSSVFDDTPGISLKAALIRIFTNLLTMPECRRPRFA